MLGKLLYEDLDSLTYESHCVHKDPLMHLFLTNTSTIHTLHIYYKLSTFQALNGRDPRPVKSGLSNVILPITSVTLGDHETDQFFLTNYEQHFKSFTIQELFKIKNDIKNIYENNYNKLEHIFTPYNDYIEFIKKHNIICDEKYYRERWDACAKYNGMYITLNNGVDTKKIINLGNTRLLSYEKRSLDTLAHEHVNKLKEHQCKSELISANLTMSIPEKKLICEKYKKYKATIKEIDDLYLDKIYKYIDNTNDLQIILRQIDERVLFLKNLYYAKIEMCMGDKLVNSKKEARIDTWKNERLVRMICTKNYPSLCLDCMMHISSYVGGIGTAAINHEDSNQVGTESVLNYIDYSKMITTSSHETGDVLFVDEDCFVTMWKDIREKRLAMLK
jgi:hypothetical protein